MTNWYDYENQEMVSLPPVGEIVFTCNSEDKVLKVKILEHTNNGMCDICVCRVIDERFSPNLGRLGYYQNFFPSDWRKDEGKKELIDKATQIIWQNSNELEKDEARYIAKQLYRLGYLKLPEGNS